jgi:hypothetical protein
MLAHVNASLHQRTSLPLALPEAVGLDDALTLAVELSVADAEPLADWDDDAVELAVAVSEPEAVALPLPVPLAEADAVAELEAVSDALRVAAAVPLLVPVALALAVGVAVLVYPSLGEPVADEVCSAERSSWARRGGRLVWTTAAGAPEGGHTTILGHAARHHRKRPEPSPTAVSEAVLEAVPVSEPVCEELAV